MSRAVVEQASVVRRIEYGERSLTFAPRPLGWSYAGKDAARVEDKRMKTEKLVEWRPSVEVRVDNIHWEAYGNVVSFSPYL